MRAYDGVSTEPFRTACEINLDVIRKSKLPKYLDLLENALERNNTRLVTQQILHPDALQ